MNGTYKRLSPCYTGIGFFLTLSLFLLWGRLPVLHAADINWSVKGSIFFIPEDNGLEGDPMPVLPMPGFSAEFSLPYNLSLGTAYDLYATYYGYSSTLGRAVPVAIENRSTFVLGNLLSFYASYVMNIPALTASGLRLRFSSGFSVDARLCLIADGLEGADLEDAAAQTAQVTSYFWSHGRWFFPFTGFGIDFVKLGNTWIGVEGRVWYPLYRTWSGDTAPAAEGWRVAAGLRVSF
ncbi:hypothetical protein [Gracilinema caldarium]|uniref:hypothetical protein n=1 Tax=Gracilinema caldarium TaxID=215591 RepID=UPI0026F20634|nr:hypothetical protein [Gracilinema caldarium]